MSLAALRYTFVATSFALAGCMQMTPIVTSTPVPLSNSMLAEIRSEVTRDFFDPDAAQFRNVRAVDVTLENGSSERRVCGEVNGKNRLGGYVGYSMFGGVIVSGDFERQDFFSACEAW